MTVTASPTPQSILEEAGSSVASANSRILVLEPARPHLDEAPILLDQPQSLIGSSADCPIRLTEQGINSRHALLLRDGNQVVIKALDRRTWLNGDLVTESRVNEGDLLAIGPVEFTVRRARAEELIGKLPVETRHSQVEIDNSHGNPPADPELVSERMEFETAADRPAIETAQGQVDAELAQLDARQTAYEFQCAWLETEREQFEAQRTQLHADRTAFERERAQFEASRLRFEEERARFDAALGPEPASAQPELSARRWNADADRFSRFFRPTALPAAVLDVDAETPSPLLETSPEQRLADGHAEVSDSVANYMQKLLQRSRSERTSRGIVDEPLHESPTPIVRDPEVSGERALEELPAAALQSNDPAPPQIPPDTAPRRRQAAQQIRAGVGSMREIANLSARAAVANHTTRKLRRSFAMNLPLMVLAFILAEGIRLLGGSDQRFQSLAFSMVMLGLVAAIELVRSWLKIKDAEANCNSSAVRAEQEGIAAPNKTDDRDLPPSAREPSQASERPEAVLPVADDEPAEAVAVK